MTPYMADFPRFSGSEAERLARGGSSRGRPGCPAPDILPRKVTADTVSASSVRGTTAASVPDRSVRPTPRPPPDGAVSTMLNARLRSLGPALLAALALVHAAPAHAAPVAMTADEYKLYKDYLNALTDEKVQKMPEKS